MKKKLMYKGIPMFTILIFITSCSHDKNPFRLPQNHLFNIMEVEIVNDNDTEVKRIENNEKIVNIFVTLRNEHLEVKEINNKEVHSILEEQNYYLVNATTNMDYSNNLYRILITENNYLVFQKSLEDKELFFITQEAQPKIVKQFQEIID
ncbi:hypothetical protein [Radiobacillus deserti]|uniref:Lipoprotein n=1 Tax=Radiobacillus deserti TaxID=2594883 RepID=A0A516KIS1_9BACI|nr:hypothetical protein [Radiobacillus deserti]QDP41300.1 hypothetical protein FN924_14580 [Radiobacillus deserti]